MIVLQTVQPLRKIFEFRLKTALLVQLVLLLFAYILNTVLDGGVARALRFDGIDGVLELSDVRF